LKNKILFIGPVNFGKYPRGGDQYKNQLLIDELTKIFTLKIVDTVTWKTNPKIWFQLFWNFTLHFQYRQIIISAATNSALKIIKIGCLFPKMNTKINYWVIGGKLHMVLSENLKLSKILNSIRQIIVETSMMNQSLKKNGITNSIKIPNFKSFNLNNLEKRIPRTNQKPLKLVFLSRVCIEKGVDIILESIRHFNQELLEIHFFGPIQREYKEYFIKNTANLNNVKYLGILNLQDELEENLNLLSQYDLFLFPTFWESEGHPGALIDAMASGLAIIASDWNSNSEFILNNGKLISVKSVSDLSKSIEFYLENPDILLEHKNNSLKNVIQYHSSFISPQYIASLS